MYRYPLCGPKGNLFFCFYNPLARLYKVLFPEKKISSPPKNILLCCEAALGDVFLALSIIPAIKKQFPSCKIGFLCKEETLPVLQNNPGIDFIHYSKKGKKKELLLEIQKNQYDASLELHPFFPNSIPLMRKARIQTRIGFDRTAYDVWLTAPVPFPNPIKYLPKLHLELLKSDAPSNSTLAFNPPSQAFPKEYLVLHLGTSNPLKEWDVRKWRQLAASLKEQGFALLFTGKGEREKKLIEEAFQGLGENLCDKLSWNDFIAVIANAKALISVDSVSIHLAAKLDVPILGLYLYNHALEMWVPDAKKASFLIANKCIRKNKVSHPKATYLDNIEAQHVLTRLVQLVI